MKKTLLSSAGVLTLSLVLAGAALATENEAEAGKNQLAVQDALNGSLNGNFSGNTAYSDNDNDYIDADLYDVGNTHYSDNLSGNTAYSNNDNDQVDADLYNVANGSFNDNLSRNTVGSDNDNDYIDADIYAEDIGNDKSSDDNDYLDADIYANDVGNNKSTNHFDYSENWVDDHSVNIENVAMLVSRQQLVGAAAYVEMQTYSGDITTGSVMFGPETNKMFAGNQTTSVNTGAGSVALSASSIQANGNFHIGNN